MTRMLKLTFFRALLALVLFVPLIADAAITFVGSDNERGNRSNARLDIPNTVQAGDLLLVHLAYRDRTGSDGNTPPGAGWTAITPLNNQSVLFQQVYYRFATASDAGTRITWDFDGGSRRMVAGLSVFRGVDTANPLDGNSVWTDRMSFNSIPARSVTTTTDDTVLVAFYSVEAGNGSFSQGVGLTEIYDRETGRNIDGVSFSAAYVSQVLAGATGDKNATVNNVIQDDAIGQLIALREASSAFPALQSVSGACGTDNVIVVEFSSAVDDSALNPALYSLNGATIDSVTRQSADTVILSVTGFVGGRSYILSFDGADRAVDFQGLLGRYFDQRIGNNPPASNPAAAFTGNQFLRLDPQVNFAWDRGNVGLFPYGDANDERFSIRWTGSLIPSDSGSYEFRLFSDDGMRAFLNGDSTPIVDDWTFHAPRFSSVSAPQNLDAGNVYEIQVEHFEQSGQAYAQLEWRRDGGSWENVPRANLTTCPAVAVPLNPVIEYRFDEAQWGGAVDDVQDSSGNDTHGDPIGGVNTSADAHLCRAAEFDGVDDYIQEGTIDDTLSGTSSLSFWIKTTQIGNNTGWRAPGVAGVEEAGGSDDIFWGWIDGSGRIGLSVGNNYSTKSTIPINDNTFHHVVLTRDAGTGAWQIYIDNVLNNSGVGTAGVIGNSFNSIGRIEDTGGTPEYFQGILDEVQIFDSVISADDVDQLFNAARNCNQLAPVAHYAFEQSPWQGGGETIEDYSGSGNTGLSSGNVQDTPDGRVCRGVDIPRNTSRAQQDAIITSFDINDGIGNVGSIMLWYRSEQDWVGGGNLTLMDASTDVLGGVVLDKYFYLGKLNDGRLRFSFEDSDDRDFNLFTGARSVTAGTWVHIAVTWDLPNRSAAIYVDGVRAAFNPNLNTVSGAIGDLGQIYFGDNSSTYAATASSAFGRMDEIRLYSQSLGASEITAIAAENHPCPNLSCDLDRFAITQPTYGLACPQSRASISIQALCADGSPKTDYAGTINLSSSENSLSEFYDAQTGGSLISSVVLDGSENGAATAYLFHQNDNNNLRVQAEDTTEGVSTTASSGTSFNTSGFLMSTPSNFTCGTTTNFTLTAIGQDRSGGGACNVLTGFAGAKNLKVWSDINIDATGKDTGLPRSMLVNGATIAETQPASNNVTGVNFNAGVATLSLGYQDVGEVIQLNVRHDDAPYDGSSAQLPNGSYIQPLSISSNSFVVVPDAILVEANSSDATCDTTDPSTLCSAFVSAGSDFSTTTTAYCAGGSPLVASSYRGRVSLTHQLVQPAGENLGSLGVNEVVFDGSESTGGQRETLDQSISEVGVFTITTDPDAYYGVDLSGADRTSSNIGRFYPDSFSVTKTDGSFDSVCSGSSNSFNYVGQPFGYATLPSATITALNADGGTTQNYTHPVYNLLAANQVERSFPNADGTQFGADGVTLLSVTSTPNQGTLSLASPNKGQMTYQFDGGDRFTYDKNANATVRVFDTDLAIALTGIEDSDGVSVPSSGLINWEPSVAQIRYGRFVAENVFGPENEDLLIQGRVEYLNTSGNYEVNDIDSCSSIASALWLTGSDGTSFNSAPFTNIPVGDGSSDVTADPTFSLGLANISFTAPGLASGSNDHTGTITVDFDFSLIPWLLHDWSGDGTIDATDDLSRSATFGQYRGNDRIIYWREVLP